MACSPGGRFFRLSLILIPFPPPLPTGVRTAVPTLSPAAFFSSTLVELAATRDIVPESTARTTTDARFIVFYSISISEASTPGLAVARSDGTWTDPFHPAFLYLTRKCTCIVFRPKLYLEMLQEFVEGPAPELYNPSIRQQSALYLGTALGGGPLKDFLILEKKT